MTPEEAVVLHENLLCTTSRVLEAGNDAEVVSPKFHLLDSRMPLAPNLFSALELSNTLFDLLDIDSHLGESLIKRLQHQGRPGCL